MNLRRLFALLLLAGSRAYCQTPAARIAEGTPLVIALDRNYPMRTGSPIEGHLRYPVYVNNELILPEGTRVSGRVESLARDRSRRTNAILGGDFTPFRIPLVSFSVLWLADGTSMKLTTGPATPGAPIYTAVAAAPKTGGFFRQQFRAGLDAARGDLAYFIAPGKEDRFVQWVYSQIPYHPQRIEKNTSWTVELASPIDIPALSQVSAAAPGPSRKLHFWEIQAPEVNQPQPGSWRIEAYLAEPVSSESSGRGDSVRAVVARPVANSDRSIVVPQGATLTGSVTQARPARWFGRSGVLTFNFNQLVVPGERVQRVETRLTAADSAQQIALDSEGQTKSRPRDKIAIPLILAVMASSPLDQDQGHEHHMGRKNATGGAAGLGLVGTIVGLAGGSPNVAAGIGYWGAARAVFGRWIAHGEKISFPKDTRIIVETVQRRSEPIHPDPASAH